MAKAKNKPRTKKKQVETETEGAYFLKLVLYFILGSQWVRLVDPAETLQIPLPIGLMIGILFASHDHFQIDRKIEFAVLLVAMFIGFWFHAGLVITIL